MTDYFKGNEIKQAFEYSEGFVFIYYDYFARIFLYSLFLF